MKSLLIGATGFLGAQLALAPGRDGAARDRIDLARPIPDDLHVYLKDYSHVILCAGITDVEKCFRDIKLSHQVNVTATLELLAQIKKAGAMPIFFSSDYVFGAEGGGLAEDAPRRPLTFYGRQKLAAEHYLEQYFGRFLLFRTGKLMAKSPHPRNILTPLLRDLSAGREVSCFTDQFINPVFIEDVATVVDHAIARGLSGAYHLGTRRVFSRYELAQFIADKMGWEKKLVRPTRLAHAAFSEPRPHHNTLNCAKIEEALGFRFGEIEESLPELRAGVPLL